MTSRPSAHSSPGLSFGIIAVLAVLMPVGPAVAGPPPSFQDSGQIFGTTKGHFGRCNAWADLDGNGLYDVITGGHGDGLLAYYQESPLQFRRVDAEIGLSQFDEPLYGILLLDFDRDGDKDIVLNQVGFGAVDGTPSLRYLRNNGSGQFGERTVEVGFSELDRGFGLAALDYDKDGWLDIYVVNHRSANALYRNLGDGSFEDATTNARVGGLNGRLGDSTGITTLDYDCDGWTDIFVTQRDEMSAEFPFGNNLLFHNQGDGTFEERAAVAGVAGFSHDFVVSSNDINNDGWPDLYVATFNFGPNGVPETDYRNRTYLNQGDGTFLDVSLGGGADYIGGCMGLALDDADNDGAPDLYVGNGGPFVPQIEDQIFYQGLGDGSFVERTDQAGLASDARGHGNTWLDVDRDGDLDLFASLGGHSLGSERNDILYLNQGPTGRSLEVSAQGIDCTEEGLGVVVEAHAGASTWRREIRATAGFDSMRPPAAWFGLAQIAQLDSLILRWPCGRRSRLLDVATDDHVVVVEPSGTVANFELRFSGQRIAGRGIRLAIAGTTDALYRPSLELSRSSPGSNWRRLRLEWRIDGQQLVASDPTAPADRELRYRVRARRGTSDSAAWITRETTVAPILSRGLWLRATPNPSAGRMQFVSSAVSGDAVLRIYDLRGRELRRLEFRDAEPSDGGLRWGWDGRDASGRPVARGAYVADLASDGRRVQRAVLRISP
jgi:enediyne biosynthesis protein E4